MSEPSATELAQAAQRHVNQVEADVSDRLGLVDLRLETLERASLYVSLAIIAVSIALLIGSGVRLPGQGGIVE